MLRGLQQFFEKRIAPPEEQASRTLLERDLVRALDELPERERMVLELRYGLTDGQRRTHYEFSAGQCVASTCTSHRGATH